MIHRKNNYNILDIEYSFIREYWHEKLVIPFEWASLRFIERYRRHDT